MSAESIVEIYRTQERRDEHFFVSAVTISYFGRTAFIQGLSGTFTIKCWREVTEYLMSKDIDQVQYYRHGFLRTIYR